MIQEYFYKVIQEYFYIPIADRMNNKQIVCFQEEENEQLTMENKQLKASVKRLERKCDFQEEENKRLKALVERLEAEATVESSEINVKSEVQMKRGINERQLSHAHHFQIYIDKQFKIYIMAKRHGYHQSNGW